MDRRIHPCVLADDGSHTADIPMDLVGIGGINDISRTWIRNRQRKVWNKRRTSNCLMELGPVGIEAHIENTHEYKWGLKINLKPFTKEELEALLAEY